MSEAIWPQRASPSPWEKGLFSKRKLKPEGFWTHNHQPQKKAKVKLKTGGIRSLYTEWWASSGSFFPLLSSCQNTPISRPCCFSGKTEAPQKKGLQILTFWTALPKTLAHHSHPQYPPGPISNASFSLKLFSTLDGICPCPEPTVAAQKLSSPICTVVTPVLPHSIYKMISVFRVQGKNGPSYLHLLRRSTLPHRHKKFSKSINSMNCCISFIGEHCIQKAQLSVLATLLMVPSVQIFA